MEPQLPRAIPYFIGPSVDVCFAVVVSKKYKIALEKRRYAVHRYSIHSYHRVNLSYLYPMYYNQG
jgi:hypothetical protein